jgi:ABC-2 type transport system ATP-binding protein
LIHNPEILILDEPTNGLDPAGIFEIREMLTDLAENHGVTIFISSHILGEISRFSTRIGIIHDGKLIQEIDTPELEKLCRKCLIIKAENIQAAHSLLVQNGYSSAELRDNTIEISEEAAVKNPEKIATLMVNGGFPPTLLNPSEEDLESYFLRIIGINRGTK